MFSCALRSQISLQIRSFSSTSSTSSIKADFTHAVIGGGAVGLAIARQLQAREGASTILIEKHGSVIHASLYYGPTSLKTKLCIRGKEQLYSLCDTHKIPYNNCGKWIVAQDATQMDAITKVHEFSKQIGVPTHFLTPAKAKELEPDVRCEAGVLVSPTTGILDSHSYMQYLQGSFEDRGGICSFHSPVVDVKPLNQGSDGWEIYVQSSPSSSSTSSSEEPTRITASTIINSAGLYAIPLSNKILPSHRRIKPFYAKGSYFSYSSSHPSPRTLIYPAPIPGHGGLGTHLTLDMSGRIRFGPDVEWTDSPSDYTVNSANLQAALDDIETYLPGVDRGAVEPDYCGIRPKMGRNSAVAGGKDFQDFHIKMEEEFEGFVNLLAIESPGLTSSLAIGEEVERLLYG
ncbi:FAD dependent oxidoreductase-like protein [Tothia fuscella]|uniref:L-2-hydroxyglutarate dehydrogenase, mitochondrial n=1 Tax=Tothia fuscella TaxID=1048955 RepID=A0A9P4NQ55_9PEZI|nr:FAD dependent oxidoreductase-like protein [Tothia fuscella]